MTEAFSTCGRGWLAGDWPSTAGVLNITAAAGTAGFQWWRSGDITRTQNVSEYMLVLALCMVFTVIVTSLEQSRHWFLFCGLLFLKQCHIVPMLSPYKYRREYILYFYYADHHKKSERKLIQ